MIKDTNPDHYKVDGANFVEYMNDPKISGFGNWMFANGFNSGVWASTNWIPVEGRLPKEHESIFHRFLGTPKWSSAMWKQESDNVIVYARFPDGTGRSTEGGLRDGKWWTRISPMLKPIVTHWMPMPIEPPKEESGDATD